MFCYLTQNIITASVLILQQKSHVDLLRSMFSNGNYILRAGALHPARNASALYSAIVLSQHFYVAGATLKSKKHHIIVQAQIWCFSDFSVACSLTLVVVNQAAFEDDLSFVIC